MSVISEVQKKLLAYLEESKNLKAVTAVEFSIGSEVFYKILGYTRADWSTLKYLDVKDEKHVDEIMKILEPATSPDVERLHDAFISEYKGDNNVADLRRDILACYNVWNSSPDDIYSPYLVIVQSSGSGKTRLVEQMSLEVWVVYICFPRDGSIGYPWASPSGVTDWLLKASGTQWQAFFRATTAVLNYLAFGKKSFSDADETENDLIVKQKVIEVLKTTPGSLKIDTFFRLLVVDRSRNGQPDFAYLFWQMVIDIADKVQFTTSDWIDWGHADFPLVFAFDEARALLPKEDENVKTISQDKNVSSPLYELRRSLANDNRRYVGLLLDTSSKVANFTPPSGKDWSGRVNSGKATLFHPHIHIPPMDCLLDKLPQCLSDVCSPEHLLKLGRPLWTKGAYEKTVDIVSFAGGKLGYNEKGRDGYAMAVALLGPRIQVSLKSTAMCASDLVSSGMAVLLKVSLNRTLLKVRYCSEPAMVAASFERMANVGLVEEALRYIFQLNNQNQSNTGDIGEFVARFILIWSWDQLVGQSDRSLEILYKPQSVEAFLSAFLGKQAVDTMKSLKPKFNSIFNGLMLLTHFAPCYLQSKKKKDFNPNLLLDLIYRGAGGCFVGDQEAVDLILPFVVGNKETDLTLENVSCIAVQVKNRVAEFGSGEATTLIHQQFVFLSNIFKHPMISILFALSEGKRPGIKPDWKKDGSLSIIVRGIESLPIFSCSTAPRLVDCSSILRGDLTNKDTARLYISFVPENLRNKQLEQNEPEHKRKRRREK